MSIPKASPNRNPAEAQRAKNMKYHFHHLDVVPNRFRRQAAIAHHRNEVLEREIVDSFERHIAHIGVDPLVQMIFPIHQSRGSQRLTLAIPQMVKPDCSLFAEGDTADLPNDLVEVLLGIHFAGRDDFLGLAFPFGSN